MTTGVVTALTLLPCTALTIPASAATTTTATYKCQGSAMNRTVEFTLTQDLTATAPESVSAGGALTVVHDPAPNKVPDTVGNFTVKEVRNARLHVPIPTNSSYVSAGLSGGAGLNSTPTVAREGDEVVISVAGPIKGGADIELPTLRLDLTAGAEGTIESKLGGTGYDDPGLTFTATIQASIITVDAPVSCYPDPNPPLTTTTIN
ncbi:cyclase [Longimycelium tulufanense]|uniref:Cyclase n=1 Tax=Longimycelium tulufanense TaxID=907463 RepID=A0A8J3FU91_9PSEU|nr:cyclase [Longimycelium tulufanense]GGM53137.1 cyclase [Longimycelium tulufanense]